MKSFPRPRLLLSLAAAFSCISLADSYIVITLDFPGSTSTTPRGINSAGQIVGTYEGATGTHGFLYSGGSFSTIDVPGAAATQALRINDIGQILGTYTDACG